jgi:NTE family protein
MKVGLALSGGGVRGIAHAGVIKALEEHGIEVHEIAGTSAGAIVGALYAAGKSIDEIYDFFAHTNIFHPTKFAFRQAGFIKSHGFTDTLKKYIEEDSFESLKIPLTTTATNLNSTQLKTFSKGPLYLPILASAAFPGIFTPVIIEEEHFVDGGVVNNFPVDLLTDCDIIIGSYVNKVPVYPTNTAKNSYDVASRAYAIHQYDKDRVKFSQCDVLIEPEGLHTYGLLSFKSLKTIFDKGYQAGMDLLKQKDIQVK